MNEILPVLNDEEILEALKIPQASKHLKYVRIEKNVANIAAKVQNKADRKSMVEWLRKHHFSSHNGFGHYGIYDRELKELEEAIDD